MSQVSKYTDRERHLMTALIETKSFLSTINNRVDLALEELDKVVDES